MSDVLATIQEFFAFIADIITSFFSLFSGLFTTTTTAEEETKA